MYVAGFIGYPVLGYYLSVHLFGKNKQRELIALVCIVYGIIITLLGTYFITELQGKYVEDFHSYLSPLVLLASMGVFVFIKSKYLRNGKIRFARNILSKYGYGIYLLHILVLWLLGHVGINARLINPLVGIPLTVLCCVGLSALIIYGLNKLPYGKYIFG